ncbi:MAG: type II toxin-antitoxin system RelE/ParE family toxin [Roseiflexaceae bacterium]
MATEDDTPPAGPPRYRDKRTEQFAQGRRIREFQAFERQAYKRLEILEAAPTKEALMLLPSNRFEALGGDRKGQFSIAINRQWRICFEWPEGEPRPFNIEIVDYH